MWSELADVYRSHVGQISDVGNAQRTSTFDLLSDSRGALGRYRRSARAFRVGFAKRRHLNSVIESLESIYERTERWEPLVSLLIRKVEIVEDSEEQQSLLFRTAGLFEDVIDDPMRAIETYRMVDEVSPDNHRAIESLERLFLALEHWQDYLEVLNRKAELTEDIEQRKVILSTIGQTYERELGDFVGAVETYQSILELDAHDLAAMRRLDQLFEHLEQWDDQLAVLQLQVEHVEGEEAALSLRFRIARLHEQQLGDLETAIQGYESILEQSSSHEQARHALEDMVREDRDADAALAVLETNLGGDAEWTRLIGVWNDYLAIGDDLDSRSRVRMHIASTYDDKLADADGAFNAYGEALKEDATNEGA